MVDQKNKTKQQLIEELVQMQRRIAELEADEDPAALVFRDLTDDIHQVFWLFDWPQQRLLYVSPAYERVWGRPVEQFFGRYTDWLDSVHPDDQSYATESFARIARTGGGEAREYRIIRPDGSIRWVSDRGLAVRDSAGDVLRIVGMAEDVTERKQVEEARRESEQRYRALVDASPNSILLVDRNRFVFANPAGLRMLGFSDAEELMDIPAIDLVAPGSRRLFAKGVAGALSGQVTPACEFEFHRRDGSAIWVASILVRIQLEGRLVVLIVGQDITRNKRVERALRESEERFSLFMNHLPAAAFMVDHQGTTVYTNRYVSEVLGNAGWPNKPFSNALVATWPEASGGDEATETICDRSGTQRTYQTYRFLIERDKGRPFLGGISIDISQSVQLQRQLEESREEYRQLAGMVIAAQEAERSRIAAELHDDITQRLALLAMDMARVQRASQGLPAETCAVLKGLQSRIEELSSDVQTLSRALHPSILRDLGLRDALLSECTAFRARGRLDVEVDAGEVPSRLDDDTALCLFRILQEALWNVAKHSRAGRVTVALHARDHEVHLTIRDDGIGFDVDKARRRRGLGLASMQERARLVDGTLAIVSQSGQGTIIEARVPVARAPLRKSST